MFCDLDSIMPPPSGVCGHHLVQLGDFFSADFHFLPQHPVLLCEHVHHLMGIRHGGEGLRLQVGATVRELDGLDRHLGLGGWGSL